MIPSTKIKSFDYPRSVKKNVWENYLGRKLELQELKLLKSVANENELNLDIKKLSHCANENNLYIYKLTDLDGDCLFESLKCYDLFDDLYEFKKMLSTIMIMCKNDKNLTPNKEFTLSEIFSLTNGISTVYCKYTDKFYKYNFDAMCLDLMGASSWSRINTELLLTILSSLLNLKIIILHENKHITKIETNVNENTMNVYIGLLSEYHYVPLKEITDSQHNYIVPRFTKYTKMIHEWGRQMAFSLGRVTYEQEDSDCLGNIKNIEQKNDNATIDKIDKNEFKNIEVSNEDYNKFVEF